MTKIKTISAKDGGLELYNGLTWEWANTVDGVANILVKNGIADRCMGSSSMDFASEEGFETDDGAALLFKRALSRANF